MVSPTWTDPSPSDTVRPVWRSVTHWTPDPEDLGMHPGQLNEVDIVDVGGDRLVIDTWHMPGTSAADLAELKSILASLRIEP